MVSKSPLGWNLVRRIEVNPDYEKSFLGIDGEEVRKWEKDMVTYNKDMLAATKSSLQAGRSGSRGDRDSGSYSGSYAGYSGGSASTLKRGKPATATSYKDHKVAEMGSGGVSGSKPGGEKRLCYQCKSADHLARNCPKSTSG